MKPIVNIYRLGRTPYVKALNIQNALFDNLKRIVTSSDIRTRASCGHDSGRGGISERMNHILESNQDVELVKQNVASRINSSATNSLILVEHEPVYTVGLRAQMYNQDYVAKLKAKLAENNLQADFAFTNRGGLVTFHGPGQLVAYPILYLGDFPTAIPNKSVKAYVKKLEETIIDTLAKVGIPGAHTVQEYPGVWLADGQRKVAFVGITCKRYVTMHGISINCDCDLFWFDHIVSCGIEDRLITSVQREYMALKESTCSQFQINDGQYHPSDGSDEVSSYPPDKPLQENIERPSRHAQGPYSRYSTQNIANAFCSSFSHHFDCELIER